MKIYANETALVKDITASVLKKYGGFIFKTHGGRYQRTGMPDILYWLNGKSYAFEIKTANHGYGTTLLQELKLKQLEKQGVHVLVATQVDQVLNFIQGVNDLP